MKQYTGYAWTLSAPTWITVGPTDYWLTDANAATQCNGPCDTSNFGVFSTGLTAKASLSPIIPSRLGNWYIKGGFQYYHIINDGLLAAQIYTGSAGGASNVFGTFSAAHQDVVVGFGGVGFNF
jgi:hypothetical protein